LKYDMWAHKLLTIFLWRQILSPIHVLWKPHFHGIQSKYKSRSSSILKYHYNREFMILQWYCISHFMVTTKHYVLKMIWHAVFSLKCLAEPTYAFRSGKFLGLNRQMGTVYKLCRNFSLDELLGQPQRQVSILFIS